MKGGGRRRRRISRGAILAVALEAGIAAVVLAVTSLMVLRRASVAVASVDEVVNVCEKSSRTCEEALHRL